MKMGKKNVQVKQVNGVTEKVIHYSVNYFTDTKVNLLSIKALVSQGFHP